MTYPSLMGLSPETSRDGAVDSDQIKFGKLGQDVVPSICPVNNVFSEKDKRKRGGRISVPFSKTRADLYISNQR